MVERVNGYLQRSFLPGRQFTSPADFNAQLAGWLPLANDRVLRRTGARPSGRVGADVAAMMDLPPVPPRVGASERVRLGRDYYVRVHGNDYSVDPAVIGRFVDVHADLTTVTVTCAGQVVAAHERCWDTHRTITDPAHVATAAQVRRAYQATTRVHPPRPGQTVAVRSLADYDQLFASRATMPANPQAVTQ